MKVEGEIITQRAAIRPYCTRPNLISIHGVYGSNSRSERVWLSLSLSLSVYLAVKNVTGSTANIVCLLRGEMCREWSRAGIFLFHSSFSLFSAPLDVERNANAR